jgi:CRISPR-associated protein Csx17
MTRYVHHLKGCAPAPLAHYLKALGILRIVGEQADRDARGWWENEHFCLATKLSKEELEAFFLQRYAPTPLLSPWNAGSGFYRTWDAKKKVLRNSKNVEALEELLKQADQRIQPIKRAVNDVRCVLPQFCRKVDVSSITDKERSKLLIIPEGTGPIFPVIAKDDSGKLQVQKVLMRFARTTPFYLCALISNRQEVKCAWLWGSGGNDGAIDYTGRFFENLLMILSPKRTEINSQLLAKSMFDIESRGFQTKAAGKVGQFFPAAAGGANVTTGTGSQQDTHLNPWDFVLLLEGALQFSSSITRKMDEKAMSRASSPFAVSSHATGHASPGTENAQRGEQWMPLWSRPATRKEVATLFAEARIQLGRQTANRPVDVARAISRLGVARGIDSFTRYGYLERNGQSTLAVALRRISVRHHPRVHLIDDLGPWLDRLQRLARGPNAPARLIHAERRLADAVFNTLTHDDTSEYWQSILRAAVAVESLQATGTAFEAGPMPQLQPEWVTASNDNSVEFRLALAIGSSAAGYSKTGHAIDPIRHHRLPLEPGQWKFKTLDKRLVLDPRVVINGRDLLTDCAALVNRRLIEAGQRGHRRLPLVAAKGCAARLGDLARFLSGSLDLKKLHELAQGFMAIDWNRWRSELAPARIPDKSQPDDAWLMLRLACLPWRLSRNLNIPAEPGLLRRLIAGDAQGAVEIARRRVGAAGIRPPLLFGFADTYTARLWAATLAFPIDHGSAWRAVTTLDPALKGSSHA